MLDHETRTFGNISRVDITHNNVLSFMLSSGYFVQRIFVNLPGMQKQHIFYFTVNKYSIMYNTFEIQNEQKRVFKNYCKTLDRAFIGWTLHMVMWFLLQHSITIPILQLLLTVHPISSYILKIL